VGDHHEQETGLNDYIASVTIPLHQGATIPKAKLQEIDRVKAVARVLHRASMMPLIS